MRYKLSYSLFVPSEIEKIINDNVSRYKEAYYYIVHYVIKKQITVKKGENKYVSINNNRVEAVIGKKAKTYIRFLCKHEILISDNLYQAGIRKNNYIINPKILLDCNFIKINPDNKLYSSLTKQINTSKANYYKLPLHLQKMQKKFKKIDFDYEAAKNWITKNCKDNNKKAMYFYSIEQIKEPRYRYFKISKTNKRLNTNLTNLKKELRQFIKGDFVSIDLKNSQPFFLAILLESLKNNKPKNKQNNNNKALCGQIKFYDTSTSLFGIKFSTMSKIHKKCKKTKNMNLSMFKNWVTTGCFYDNFMKYYSNNYSRDKVKDIMLGVFFSHNFLQKKKFTGIPYKKDKEIFAKVFPDVYDLICLLKEKNNRDLAVLLQKIESEVFINQISKKLVENNIIPFTVHDSVIVEAEHTETTLKLIQGVFKAYTGVIPEFDVKDTTCNNL